MPTTSDNLESDDKAEADSNTIKETNIENVGTDESNIWKEKEDMEKTREEEFEEYLADLFM